MRKSHVSSYRNQVAARPGQPVRTSHSFVKPLLALLALLLLISSSVYVVAHRRLADAQKNTASSVSNNSTVSNKVVATEKIAPPPTNNCAANDLSKLILVSITQQHLWACEGTKQTYEAAVITGMELYPADLTPTGTYHIYAKSTNQTLAGHDSTGSWSDFVNYWMPFLDNQYGTYGFHDLTQTANGSGGRADSDFGNVDINLPYTAAKHGSHGCVELPLATAKWLYNWSSVGTTVTIQS